MRKVSVALAVLLFAFLSCLLYAADVTGQWKSQAGDDPSFTFTLRSDRGAVTGTMQNPDGKESPISDGNLDGDTIAFSVTSEWQGNPVKLVARGKVKGDEIDLTIGTDNGTWSTHTTLKRTAESGK
jgi:hypothetical protein